MVSTLGTLWEGFRALPALQSRENSRKGLHLRGLMVFVQFLGGSLAAVKTLHEQDSCPEEWDIWPYRIPRMVPVRRPSLLAWLCLVYDHRHRGRHLFLSYLTLEHSRHLSSAE